MGEPALPGGAVRLRKETFARLARGALDAVLAGVSLNRRPRRRLTVSCPASATSAFTPTCPAGYACCTRAACAWSRSATGPPTSPAGCRTRRASTANSSTLLSVGDADARKPAPAAYAHAARVLVTIRNLRPQR